MNSCFDFRFPRKGFATAAAGVGALAAVCGLAADPAAAASYKILHNFSAGFDGQGPLASLIMDAKGNLYGTTGDGGGWTAGVVFELSPPATTGGKWTETVLHSFAASYTDGKVPVASLIMDANGNLYGTTWRGGANNLGLAFELSPPATTGGKWKEKMLYSFGASSTDGILPRAGLIMDANGDLYGTTYGGGASSLCGTTYGCGAVFELSPPAATTGGKWTEKLLHSFGASSADGFTPLASLFMDANGHLYGTTYVGGAHNEGTVFELTP